MSDTDTAGGADTPRIERREGDTHADTRFFKLLEVAYNCARNGYYGRAAAVASEAVAHHAEALDGEES